MAYSMSNQLQSTNMTSIGFSLGGPGPANLIEAREREKINRIGDTIKEVQYNIAPNPTDM